MKIIIDNYPYYSLSVPQGKLEHFKLGEHYFSLSDEKPLQRTMKLIKNDKILYLSNKLTDYIWNFDESYGGGDQFKVITGNVTTDYCMKCKIHFYSIPYSNDSHRGNNGGHVGKVTVKAVNLQGQELLNETITLWTYLGGDARSQANQDRDILNKEFEEPVKITYEWSLDLGGYVAHIWGGQNWISVVKNIKMDITCD